MVTMYTQLQSTCHASIQQVYGTAAEYRLMYRNFRRVFQQQNVTNARFVLDLSCNVPDWAFVLKQLYPVSQAANAPFPPPHARWSDLRN